MILDGSESLLPEDKEILESVRDKKIITLINKSDKESNLDKEELASIIDTEIIDISAKTGDGLEDLKDVLTDMFFRDEIDFNDQIYITNSRHKAALISANESLGKVLESIDSAMGEDFYTIDLMAAYESLGDIIGETLEDDLADKIFSEFCMGK